MLPSLENTPKRLVLKVLLSLDNITLLLINTSVNTRKLLAILPMNSLLRPLINSLVLFHNIGYTRSNSYKDPQHAQIVKKNYLNWYGVGIIAGSFFGALLFLRRLRYYFIFGASDINSPPLQLVVEHLCSPCFLGCYQSWSLRNTCRHYCFN